MASVRAVDRAIDILEAISASPDGKKIAELESLTGIARPTLYRLVRTLVNRGLLHQCDDPTRYAVDAGVLALARPWLRSTAVPALVDTALGELYGKVDETVALSLLREGTRVYVRELVSRHPLTYSVGVGSTETLVRGASGLAIFAFLAEEARQQVLAETAAPPPAGLAQQIETVRARGYALSEGQILEGATAIAAPFFDRGGEVAGSVGVHGPSVRFAESRIAEFAPALIACAQTVSQNW